MKNVFAALSFILIVSSGCKKEGPVGPAGKDGNANVKSKVVMFLGSKWEYPGHYVLSYGNNQVSTHFTRTYEIEAPEITKSVIENGMVQVFMIPQGVHNWVPLPFTSYVMATDLNHHFTYEYRQGHIRLHYFWTANSKGTPVPWDDLEDYLMPTYRFRYVVVDGLPGE